MFAAAAMSYTRLDMIDEKDGGNSQPSFVQSGAWYPVPIIDGGGRGAGDRRVVVERARFSSSSHKHFYPADVLHGRRRRGRRFDGNLCDAETPIGQALMCPANNISKCPKQSLLEQYQLEEEE